MFPRILKTRDDQHLVIREAEASDAALLLAYFERVSGETSFLSFGPGEFEMTEAEEAVYLDRCRGAANCLYVLAFVDQTLAGTLSCASSNRKRLIHVAEFGITVSRACWGKGVGDALMDSMLDWAKASGIIKKINLKVRADNAPAIKLYKKKGFEVEGVLKKENFVDGVYHDLLHMGVLSEEF